MRCLLVLCWCATLMSVEPLVVHEWGTFTVLQDADGNEIRGVNVDDEPVPDFVYQLHKDYRSFHKPVKGDTFVQAVAAADPMRLANGALVKSVPMALPAVTMRMETPVIYFHPPDKQEFQVDVGVTFKGGWISEWYPQVTVLRAPGFTTGALTPSVASSVKWKSITVNKERPLVQTDEAVWLAPRQVNAATLSSGNDTEKYLFYRGVASLRSPISVQHQQDVYTIQLRQKSLRFKVPQMWLVDINVNGEMAFHTFKFEKNAQRVAYQFKKTEYAASKSRELRDDMRAALIQDGLFADEAEAMLETWKQSYFQNHGRRLFYIMPRSWTDDILPLTVESSAYDRIKIERSMVGRIELMTKSQERLLDIISAAKPDNKWYFKGYKQLSEEQRKLVTCAGPNIRPADLEALGFRVPDYYRAYLDLGRFRDAFMFANSKRFESFNSNVFMK